MSYCRRPLSWTKYVWRTEYWRSGKEKPPPPDGFLICKGSTHVAASREFVDYVINNKSAHALRDWMRDIRAPDEHFFQSLNHNPQKGVPGSFKGTTLGRILLNCWTSINQYKVLYCTFHFPRRSVCDRNNLFNFYTNFDARE